MSRPSRLTRIVLCAALAAVGMGATAQAQNKQGPRVRIERSQAEREAGQGRPASPHHRRDAQRALAESVRRAERATRGQVLSAERVQYDGRDLNRVKLVDDRGRVRVYWDDPEQGRGNRGGSEPRTRDDDDGSD